MVKEINNLTDLLDSAPDKFMSQIPAIERKMLNEINLLIKDLKIKDGRLVSNAENLKKVNAINKKLEKVIITKEYLKDLKEYASSFTKAANLANAYFKSVTADFKPTAYYKAIRDTAINNTIDSFTTTGINTNIIKPVSTMLMTAVTTGQGYTSLVESLRSSIVSSGDNIGSLSRYASTYTVTFLSQFTGQYMAAINNNLGFKWYRYVGGNIATTREFCHLMTKKEWIHESEFKTVLSGDIDGQQVKMNERTGLPAGMIEGTDETSFPANVGGWGCRHQLYAVPDSIVPKELRQKFE